MITEEIEDKRISFDLKPYYQDELITLYQEDCRKVLPFLRGYELLLTDPPYGMDVMTGERNASRGLLAVSKNYGQFKWDKKPVPQWLIDQCVAKCFYSIIFGGNYYNLPATAKCWLVWDKVNGETDFADCELAWTNLPTAVRKISHTWHGMIRQGHEERYHPTQKPFRVMLWAIDCAKKAGDIDSILDPFAGSGTTLVAAQRRGIKATGIERNPYYCDIAVRRLNPRFKAKVHVKA